ncbi:type IX secretion system sortase PorU [Belliella baltica]|uniref:type IX secretion system sortase PorU n=1 Tax=Belliella baltica TaxID=232259 RepID=UPI0002F139C1|nr:type IX secretion system sortase PorU [Belliella baltica]
MAAQEQYFKFPVKESGVYKITSNQISNFGASALTDISIYGNAGLLPQKLDSIDLSLREIPSKIIGDELFFYLEGPHQVNALENDWEYQHHYYTDTVFYLISAKTPVKRITDAQESHLNSSGNLFQIIVKKEEDTNLLSSGRNWYGNPIFSGQAYNHTFSIPAGNSGQAMIKSKVMAQSLQTSQFNLLINGQNRSNFTIPSIPNAIYGIKGREESIKLPLNLENNSPVNFQLSYQTSDVNGGAYIDFVSIAVPYPNTDLPSGIYFHLSDNLIQISPISDRNIFILDDIYRTRFVSASTSIQLGEKVVVFNTSEAKIISQFKPANLELRSSPISQSLVIITNNQLKPEADRLANHKNNIGISTRVVLLQDIFDAFGYGTYDITAIRNFLSYHYNLDGQIENVLFFGKGTFDYKGKISGGRPNLIPSYSSRNSLNPLATYSSDDYFGFLDFGQGEWEESSNGDEILKVGVGRIPAISTLEAREMVDKIIAYELKSSNLGDWKRKIALFADDADNNIHLNDAESHADFLTQNHPEYLLEKIYLDRYEQIRTAGRQSSPQAKEALTKTIEEGVLIFNFIGHGNETTLTAERVFQTSDLRDWIENPLLPLFVTATCEFGRHDSPFLRSGAEEMLFAEKKGVIGLLTTGRPVFSSINFALNKAFIENVFQKENGETLDLGEIFKRTKNNSLNGALNRNFSLLGDPSLKLATPELESKIKEIIDIQLEVGKDTLSALQKVAIHGSISDPLTNARVLNATGTYKVTLFDKKEQLRTLGDESTPTSFMEEGNVLFQGSGDITNGEFELELIVPQNINYEFGEGIIRVFAELENGQEAIGAEKITIGGTNSAPQLDTEGPEITMLFGNEYGENFEVFQGNNIKLLAKLSDASGVNISSNNIGQDILLRINNNDPVSINNLYFSIGNTFTKGEIRVPIEGLVEGINIISLEAWDNVGNRSILEREIHVDGSRSVKILKNTTYPNPSEEVSNFKIEHNRAGENLILYLRVFSTSGHEIYQASKRYVRANYILDDFAWIFFHSKTKYPVKGTYIYELQLVSEFDNTSDKKSGKIIIK